MKPVVKDQLVRERVVDMSHEGNGVIKIDNYTIFVENCIVGDLVDARITRAKKNFGLARAENIVEESAYRIRSKCPYSDQCGGCQLQDMSYEGQLIYKREKIKSDLYKFGHIDNIEVPPIVGMEHPYNYRNNVQLPVTSFKGKPVIGYFKKSSKFVVDIDTCLIQNPLVDEVIEVLRDFMEAYSLEGYNARLHKGLIRHLVVRTNQDNEAMVILVTNSRKIPYEDELVKMFRDRIVGLKTLVHNINMERTSLSLARESRVLYGDGKLIDRIGDLEFEISPESFFQVNALQTERLYERVRDYLDLDGSEKLVDLYCGIGTIGIYLADKAKHVKGIELVPKAVENANRNKELNSIDNIDFIQGDAEEVFTDLVNKGIEVDALVVDPPRKGLDQDLIASILKLKPKKIAYVSCNPSTLARDLKELKEVYRIEKIEGVDMFPHTVHVETVVLLEKE